MQQREQQQLEVEDGPFGAAAAGSGDDTDALAGDRADEVAHAASAVLVPEIDEGRAPQLAAKGRAQARAGNAERVPGADVAGQDEGVGERPADRPRLDIG